MFYSYEGGGGTWTFNWVLKTVSTTLPQVNQFLEEPGNSDTFGCFHNQYFPLPFLAFQSTFSVFRSRLAFCPSLKIKTIKNLCLPNILLFKKGDSISLPLHFFSQCGLRIFSLFRLPILWLETYTAYFERLVAGLWPGLSADSACPPLSLQVSVLLLEAQLCVLTPAWTILSTPEHNPHK